MLPTCPPHRDAKSSHLLLKVVLAIVSLVLCLIFFLLISIVLCLRAKYREGNTIGPLLGDNHPQVYYHELEQATEGFAPANLIGAGKYGSVYNGSLPIKKEGASGHVSSLVAVKVFNLELLGSLKSFVAECEVRRSIRHSNLLRIVTYCSSIYFQGNDFKALVYDFMPNSSLDTWLHTKENLQQEPITAARLLQRLNIALDVADALDYLHNNCHPSSTCSCF